MDELAKVKSSTDSSSRRTLIIIGIIAIVWIILSIMTDGSFFTLRNISNLLRQMSMVAIMGTGMVLVIVSGGIDLSVGAMAGCLGMIAAAGMKWWDWGTGMSVVVVLLLGLAFGATQGLLIAYGGVPPFIATLGGMMALQGIQVTIGRGMTVSPLNKDFLWFGQSYTGKTGTYIVAIIAIIIFSTVLIMQKRSRIKYQLESKGMISEASKAIIFVVVILGFGFLMNLYESIPIPVVFMFAIMALMIFIAGNTSFGRSIYAIGSNRKAALFAGIKVKKTVVGIYMISALLAAIAGIILASRLNAGSSSMGRAMEMSVIAAAVIGGTRMSGGYGKITGAILGALFMATLENGMSLLHLQSYHQDIVQGVVLALAVFIDKRTSNDKEF